MGPSTSSAYSIGPYPEGMQVHYVSPSDTTVYAYKGYSLEKRGKPNPMFAQELLRNVETMAPKTPLTFDFTAPSGDKYKLEDAESFEYSPMHDGYKITMKDGKFFMLWSHALEANKELKRAMADKVRAWAAPPITATEIAARTLKASETIWSGAVTLGTPTPYSMSTKSWMVPSRSNFEELPSKPKSKDLEFFDHPYYGRMQERRLTPRTEDTSNG